ncbi:hypothetical protein CLI64_19415 [Nostoc sp. CENA543]|uniref:hypothetical protein n=1 Tax=Nostoc sp. CENA543 TaxID=1869241 RepID=UPI000CA22AB6|nr:hypothetical protein [Nostoc sp. CENA543]AUT02386.1 hypothetical protein CLI64_19415 [Nostoc sp. CENA543]
MANIKYLAEIIATKGENPLIVSIINQNSQADAELDRQLRELQFRQELRKDWILFIVRDLVIFSTTILFILLVSGYALFMHIYR